MKALDFIISVYFKEPERYQSGYYFPALFLCYMRYVFGFMNCTAEKKENYIRWR